MPRARVPAAPIAPESLQKSFPPPEGVGNAGCPLHPQPRAQSVASTRVSSPRSHRDRPAFPHANGFNGFLRDLPGDRAFLSPSPPRSLLLKDLNASVEASGPHDFAVRESLPQKLLDGPGTGPAEALWKVDQRRSSYAAAASTASHPNVRDDRDTPLVPGQDGGDLEVIWVGGEGKSF
jgi:hypothetical protein